DARRRWLSGWLSELLKNDFRDALVSRYGPEPAAKTKYCEAFELCEYGRQPSAEELDSLFPM
ncbi:MAG TPA: PIG-L family deacetylase, partial [Terriglobia bacterium]